MKNVILSSEPVYGNKGGNNEIVSFACIAVTVLPTTTTAMPQEVEEGTAR